MRKPLTLLVAATVVLATLLSGCATVFKGGVQDVPVNSDPEGVEIIIDGVSFGRTPTTLQLQVNRSYNIVLRNGTEERMFTIRNEIGALWIVLDVVTGLVPVIVDAATGNWYELQPGQVYVDFTN